MPVTEQQIEELEGPISAYEQSESTEDRCIAVLIRALIADLREAQDTIYTKDCEYKQAGRLAASYLIELQQVRAKLAEAEKDAKRYRYLRSNSTGPSAIWELMDEDAQPQYFMLKSEAHLDEAIDAAIAAQEKPT